MDAGGNRNELEHSSFPAPAQIPLAAPSRQGLS